MLIIQVKTPESLAVVMHFKVYFPLQACDCGTSKATNELFLESVRLLMP